MLISRMSLQQVARPLHPTRAWKRSQPGRPRIFAPPAPNNSFDAIVVLVVIETMGDDRSDVMLTVLPGGGRRPTRQTTQKTPRNARNASTGSPLSPDDALGQPSAVAPPPTQPTYG